MEFQTKPEICNYMAALLPNRVSEVLEPTPGEGNLVRALMAHGFHVTAPVDFWNVDDWFDAVVMNPPFTPMANGYEILWAVMDMTEIVVALMPWLTLINSEKRTAKIKDWGLRSVTHLPRSAFPGARVQTCILEMCRGYPESCELRFWS